MTFLQLQPKNGGKLLSDFIPVVQKVENNRPPVQLESEPLAVEPWADRYI